MSFRVGYGRGRYNKGLFNQTLGETQSAVAIGALSSTVSAFTRLRTLAGTVLSSRTFVSAFPRLQSFAGTVAATATAVFNFTVALGIDFVATTATSTMTAVINRIQGLAVVVTALSTISAIMTRIQQTASVVSASASAVASVFGTFAGAITATAVATFVSAIRHLYVDTGFSTTTYTEQTPSTKTYTEQIATTKTYSEREV